MLTGKAEQGQGLVPGKRYPVGNSVAVQWLGLGASTAGGTGSIPGQGTRIPQAAWWRGQKKKKKEVPGKGVVQEVGPVPWEVLNLQGPLIYRPFMIGRISFPMLPGFWIAVTLQRAIKHCICGILTHFSNLLQ